MREVELRGGALGIEMRASRDRAEVTRVERRRRVQVQVEQLLALERVKRKGIGDQQTLQRRTTVLWASQLGQRTALWGEEGGRWRMLQSRFRVEQEWARRWDGGGGLDSLATPPTGIWTQQAMSYEDYQLLWEAKGVVEGQEGEVGVGAEGSPGLVGQHHTVAATECTLPQRGPLCSATQNRFSMWQGPVASLVDFYAMHQQPQEGPNREMGR